MAYPAATWARIKAEYETGNFSIPQLAEKWVISDTTIDKRIAKENWNKGELKPRIELRQQELMINALAKKGVTQSKVAGVLHEMLEAERTLVTPSNEKDKDGNKEPGFAEIIPDHNARDKAVTQIFKVTGAYAAEKKEVELKGWIMEVSSELVKAAQEFIPKEKHEEFLKRIDGIFGR